MLGLLPRCACGGRRERWASKFPALHMRLAQTVMLLGQVSCLLWLVLGWKMLRETIKTEKALRYHFLLKHTNIPAYMWLRFAVSGLLGKVCG